MSTPQCRLRAEPYADLPARYRIVRDVSAELCVPLSPEDCVAQSMVYASPAKWHLAHTTWFFETFVLARQVRGYRDFHPHYRMMFNSYYNTVGVQHARPERGLLTRPSFDEVLDYRGHVDREMLACMHEEIPAEVAAIIELGLHHEQQHQELILMDIKHLFSRNPLQPAYQEADRPAVPRSVAPLQWLRYDEGVRSIGAGKNGFAFDNEGPRHAEYVRSFELANRAVTTGEFCEFIEDRGYQRPELWLSDGWDRVRMENWFAPLYWSRQDTGWQVFTLNGTQPVEETEPVVHVSFYEADAYARWASARLPTESEWESVAATKAVDGNFMEEGLLSPRAANQQAHDTHQQLFGDVWEWTQSPYTPYPGYVPPAGALGEYNGKFMCNQMVLRGGACVTPRSHIRATYRNFFQPELRWQFSGIRLARDAH